MNAVVGPADATILVALIVTVGAWWQARRNGNQMKPNAGSSLRDAVDRIEAALKHEVIPRLDRGAELIADHSDRITVLEAKSKRAKDTPCHPSKT